MTSRGIESNRARQHKCTRHSGTLSHVPRAAVEPSRRGNAAGPQEYPLKVEHLHSNVFTIRPALLFHFRDAAFAAASDAAACSVNDGGRSETATGPFNPAWRAVVLDSEVGGAVSVVLESVAVLTRLEHTLRTTVSAFSVLLSLVTVTGWADRHNVSPSTVWLKSIVPKPCD